MDKLDQGTQYSDFQNRVKIVFNRYKARDQALEQDIKSAMDAELKFLQTQLKKVTEEKDRLCLADGAHQETIAKFNTEMAHLAALKNQFAAEKEQLTYQNMHLIAVKTQLVAENNQLAAQKAELLVAVSEMETNNEKLTKALIKAENEKKELLEQIGQQTNLMEKLNECKVLTDQLSAKLAAKEKDEENEREKLQESINELFNKKKKLKIHLEFKPFFSLIDLLY